MALAITNKDIVTLVHTSWEKSGLVKGDNVINTLGNLLDEITVEELSIPYTAIAIDLQNEKEVWINSGSLFTATRASTSLPLRKTLQNLA